MVSFPNCKINIGLHIVEKRTDGYHNLETVFFPLPLYDVLEIIPARDSAPSFNITGLPVAGDPTTNLCVKAWQILKKDFPDLPEVLTHLHKNIPMGAGLGGGSADGAFMLKMLNDKFRLGLSAIQLENYALQLGSDCPFFIRNKSVFASGRGELFEEVDIDLSSYHFLVINPGLHIGTAQAFSLIKPKAAPTNLRKLASIPVTDWKASISNDFETSAFHYHPDLQKIKDWLYQQGAIYASMTGSGSSFYGIFENSPGIPVAGLNGFDPSWKSWLVPAGGA